MNQAVENEGSNNRNNLSISSKTTGRSNAEIFASTTKFNSKSVKLSTDSSPSGDGTTSQSTPTPFLFNNKQQYNNTRARAQTSNNAHDKQRNEQALATKLRKVSVRQHFCSADNDTTSESEVPQERVSRHFGDDHAKKAMHHFSRNRSLSSTSNDSNDDRETVARANNSGLAGDVHTQKTLQVGRQMSKKLSNKLMERSDKTLLNRVITDFDREVKADATKDMTNFCKTMPNRDQPNRRRPKRPKRKRGPPIEAAVIITNRPLVAAVGKDRNPGERKKKIIQRKEQNCVPVTRIDNENPVSDDRSAEHQRVTYEPTMHGSRGVSSRNESTTDATPREEVSTDKGSMDEEGLHKRPALQELGDDLSLLLAEHKQIRNRLQSCLDSTNKVVTRDVVKRSKTDLGPSRRGSTETRRSPRNVVPQGRLLPGQAKDVIMEGNSFRNSIPRQLSLRIPDLSYSSSLALHLDNNTARTLEDSPHMYTSSTDTVTHTKISRRNNSDNEIDRLDFKYQGSSHGNGLLKRSSVELQPIVTTTHRTNHEKRQVGSDDRKVLSHRDACRPQKPVDHRDVSAGKLRQDISGLALQNANEHVYRGETENGNTSDFRSKHNSNNNVPMAAKHVGRLTSTAYELATALDSPPGSDQNSKPSTNTSFFHAEGQSIKSYIDKVNSESIGARQRSWSPSWVYVVFYFLLWSFVVKLMDGIESTGPTECTTSEEIRQWSCVVVITLLYGITEIYWERKGIGQTSIFMMFMIMLILISHSQPIACRFPSSSLNILNYIQAGHNFLLAALIAVHWIYTKRIIRRKQKKLIECIEQEGTVDSIIRTEDEDDSLFTFKVAT